MDDDGFSPLVWRQRRRQRRRLTTAVRGGRGRGEKEKARKTRRPFAITTTTARESQHPSTKRPDTALSVRCCACWGAGRAAAKMIVRETLRRRRRSRASVADT